MNLEEAARNVVYGNLEEKIEFKNLVKTLMAKLSSSVEKRELRDIESRFGSEDMDKKDKKWIMKHMTAQDIAIERYEHLKKVFG